MTNKCVIVGAKRTPFGKYLGSLSEMEPLDVAVHAGRAALNAQGKDLSGEVEQIFAGNCIPGIFRRRFGDRPTNRPEIRHRPVHCDSRYGMLFAHDGVAHGSMGYAVGRVLGCAGRWGRGNESCTAYLPRLKKRVRIGEVKLKDFIFPISYPGYNSVAVDAANGADKYKIPKRMLDTWSMGSQRKWAEADAAGKFDEELVPIPVKRKGQTFLFAKDEFPRPDGSLAAIEQFPPCSGPKPRLRGMLQG